MKNLKNNELQKMKIKDLKEKLMDLRKERSELISSAGRGTLKKESGSLKSIKRNIARVLTVMNKRDEKEDSD
ncbi:MAG TPA: 50S ribosomal protein L29 [Nitrososphaerales archaeon]|jgi:large subunit ribosomal protein L29|nr:50S ribosomal protein L29 [Nitrososphaerales archaeon]|tara:strand:- start:997 stop:1212 length:216 start_codon:yes stop_codon:yes gene_type:complete